MKDKRLEAQNALFFKGLRPRAATYSYRIAIIRHPYLPYFDSPASYTYRITALGPVEKQRSATYTY